MTVKQWKGRRPPKYVRRAWTAARKVARDRERKHKLELQVKAALVGEVIQ